MDPAAITEQLANALKTYWGYDQFRPLQQDAMNAVMRGQDSVVVLPTGGGKSICFQAPALCMEGMAVVVSPLISLMKDQVDALRECGISAAFVNSTLSVAARREVVEEVRSGQCRLLYIAPERLLTEQTITLLQAAKTSFFAIDEAHCISAWGHDFRPEYRGLKDLRKKFPGTAFHAYTATASESVRQDMITELAMQEPEVIVGSFDRPNLIYKFQRRNNRMEQICRVLERHKQQSGIIYCISRKDVEAVSQSLNDLGYRTRPYHAGLPTEERQRNQDAFISDEIETIVATVAFGMGIDKSDVRYVIHAGMPKSLEHYQQESGRAGRDGLDAECHLFFSGQDLMIWERIVSDMEPTAAEGAKRSLRAMYDICNGVTCRHRSIIEYFGETWQKESCQACDVCLGDLDQVEDPMIIGQKILSCVVRLHERFGGDYTASVLLGSKDKRILQARHNELSTWGILESEQKRTIRDWIEQLVSQDYLNKVGEYNVLNVTATGWNLLRGDCVPTLLKSRQQTARKQTTVATQSWKGVDRELFEHLRQIRHDLASQRQVPAYVVFNDASLREMARIRPTRLSEMERVKGVGQKKLEDLGQLFVDQIAVFCQHHELTTNQS